MVVTLPFVVFYNRTKEGIMKEILEAHRMEAKEMLFTEYNEEAHINHVKKSSYENGKDITSKLYQKLKELDRLDDFDKAMGDPEYRDQLIEEFFPDKAK